jgi:hypothetical protein
MPIDYRDVKGPKGKADRIRTLEWRFQQGRIKYLANCETRWPWAALFAQTRDFTYDLSNLPFDDAIDTVAQGHYIVHGKGSPARFDPEAQKSLNDLVKEGTLQFQGIPLMTSVGSQNLTDEMMQALEEKSAQKVVSWNEQESIKTMGRRQYYVGRERFAGK